MSVLIETALTVRPIGIFDRFLDIFANEALGLTKRHGFDLIGAWRRSAGTAQQVLHVHRFDSLAAYEQARASIQRDPARLGLPEKFGAEMSIAEVSSVGAPTPYATEARLENALSQAAPPLGYLQRISRVHFPHREEVVELVGKIVDAVEATGAISLVTAYEATIGRSSDVSDLFLLPKGEAALSEANAAERAIDGGAVADRFHALLEDELVYMLQPLAYSPLQ